MPSTPSHVEELIAVPASVSQAMRALTTVSRLQEWIAPDVTLIPRTNAPTLGTGDRFRLDLLGGLGFDYLVEAVSGREVVFAFSGPWSGHERWSFVADGAETVVRRAYDVNDSTVLGALAWRAIGRPMVIAHYKLELGRFRDIVSRDPGPRAEIEPTPETHTSTSFPIDDG